MREFKKILSLILAVMLLVSLLCCMTGCGPEEDEGDTADVKIVRVWLHKSEAEDEGMVYQAIADAFNEQNFKTEDGRTIQMRLVFKNSADTLATSIQAEVLTGGLPDIVAVDAPDISAYADAGILQAIDQYITAEEKVSYVDSVIEQGTVDGKLYALSGMDCPTGLYYNKDLLAQVGYTEADYGTPENPWSWPQLMEAMDKLKEAGLPYKIKLNLGFGGDEGIMYLYSSLVYSAGGSFTGADEKASGYLDSAASINGIKMLEPVFQVDANGEGYFYNGSNTDAFASGEVAFQIYGPWDIANISKQYAAFENSYDIMPMPVYQAADGTKGTAVAGCGSWCFGVTKNAKDVNAAAIAVKFLTNAFSSELMYESVGTFPTHKESLEKLGTDSNKALASLSEILLKISTPRPKLVNYPKLSDGYSSIVEYIETAYGTADYNLEEYIKTQIAQIDR